MYILVLKQNPVLMFNPENLDLLTNEKPDERQIMTYVSCYYHAFQGAMQVLDRAASSVSARVFCDITRDLYFLC